MIWNNKHRRRSNKIDRRNKLRRIKGWHLWFAWRPVSLNDGRVAWLSFVERIWEYGYAYDHHWQYKSVGEKG